MPLPVAVGGRAVSAETLPRANCREEDSDDGIPLMPVELYQTIGWGVCPQNEWLVRVTTGYYDLMDFNKGGRDCTMCELRIQVSLLAKPLSKQYRETVHHLKLVDGANDDYPQFQPQVAVSQDRRNLAVLLFHPHQQSSAVVILQLRKPRSDLPPKTSMANSKTPMPLPAYCNKISYKRQAPAVAPNPNIVSVWGISAICSIPNVLPSVFLAACNDGSLIWLDARSSTTIATGTLAISSKQLPVSSLSVSAKRLERGCLLAVSSATGHCILAQWKLESGTAVQQTKLERNSTGDLMVRSQLSAKQEEHHQDCRDDQKQNHDLAESYNPVDTSTEDASAATTHHTSSDNNEKSKGENHRALSSRSSTNNEQHDGIQNALKGLKSNRFWSSIAPKNLSTLASNSTNSKANTTKNCHSTTNAQPINWKSAFYQNDNSPEQNTKEGVPPEREKETTEREARQQKNHMNQFVLQELRKRTTAASWVKRSTGRRAGPRTSLQRRRRRSDVAGQQEDPLRSIMNVGLLSVLEQRVVAARFGTSPTVVCVVYQAARKHPQVAQMFSISEIGTLQPIVSLHLTSEQIEEAMSLQSTNAIVSDEDWDIKNSINTKFGLDLHIEYDTFAISTAVGDQWIGCVWNWRTNAIGLIVQNEANLSLWSRLYFGKEKQTGLKLCYLETCIQDLRIQTHKHLITAGVLSPPNSRAIQLESCPLFLAADFVAFPYLSHEINNGTQQLAWKSSTLPLSYINAYGAPKFAAVGRQNSATIAIASSSGVCLLDNKYRWKQFGTPIEESSFSIILMEWWEGNGTKKSEENEDLLVTIIELRSGKQYLSCWSPKRLGTSHQLLVSASPDTGTETKWGIPLAEDVKVSSLMLLAEPSSKSDGAQQARKAVVFVASTDPEASELVYTTFQLQLSTPLKGRSEKRSNSVLTSKTISGILKDGTRSIGPISSIFLAGASFRFDLQDRCTSTLASSLVATVGVVRSPGGLEVISYDARNTACQSTLVHTDELSKISLVDVVHGADRLVDTFVWAIELLNGEIFCWSVPSLLGAEIDETLGFYSVPIENDTLKPSVLHPPVRVCKRDRRNKLMRYAMGNLSHAGSSSDWMQRSAVGCQSDMFVGPIPHSTYDCGLRTGQRCRKYRRANLYGTSDDSYAADINVSESDGPSNFMITPPAFVPSLYSMHVETAYRRIRMAQPDDSNMSQELKEDKARILSIERHIHNRMTTIQNKDAVTMTLRLFVLRTVEMVADLHKRHGKAPTDASQAFLLVATTVLSEVIESVRRFATDLQFASLFLEVGRQMEPSCLPHLFLPPPSERSASASQSSLQAAMSVADLFGKTAL
ncbi:unnamed protein product [Cylindrotheca closterium]|uniref:Uncharacterized protein n=1 Tax=Cylindrotheca closterium TaxID=2856 RepID=A0AAD2FTK5_9STRA|nr:unnamed protein product [Cylindrotheca closterium]